MIGFPLLLIPLAIYNIIVFLMPGVSFGASLFSLPMMSGAPWTVTLSDAMLAFGLLLLLLEIIKGARPLGKYVTDHLLALLIFAGAAAEFVMLPQFATSTFFLLTLLALIDFLTGISLRARRPRRVAVAEPVSVTPDPVREPRLDTTVNEPAAIVPSTSAVVQPLAPEVLETVPPRAAEPGKDVQSLRIEPIIDNPGDVAEIERERRSDEIILSGRAPSTS